MGLYIRLVLLYRGVQFSKESCIVGSENCANEARRATNRFVSAGLRANCTGLTKCFAAVSRALFEGDRLSFLLGTERIGWVWLHSPDSSVNTVDVEWLQQMSQVGLRCTQFRESRGGSLAI